MMTSSKCKQICINILSLCKHQQKNRDLKLKFFCCLNCKSSRVFRGLEQLSSLFWRRFMAIYKMGVIQPRFPFLGVERMTTFWFLWHNFASRFAGKPRKASKDSDDRLVPQKIGSLDWRPGPRTLGKKTLKHPHVWRPPREPQTQNEQFFLSQLEDFLNP